MYFKEIQLTNNGFIIYRLLPSQQRHTPQPHYHLIVFITFNHLINQSVTNYYPFPPKKYKHQDCKFYRVLIISDKLGTMTHKCMAMRGV